MDCSLPSSSVHGITQARVLEWVAIPFSKDKSFLMRVKEESEKAVLKLNIKTAKIIASSSITSWQIDGKTMETVTDFILLGSKITADGDCCCRCCCCVASVVSDSV